METAQQSGILPYRLEDGALQVLLITSRETGRWVIPKGNIGKGMTPREAAVREAYEEAGVRGEVEQTPLGAYIYDKILKDGTARPTLVEVFAMQVRKTVKSWPEMDERRSEWVAPALAAQRVREPGLAALILSLAQRDPGSETAA